MSERNSVEATHKRNSSAPLFLMMSSGGTYLISMPSAFAFAMSLFE